MACSYQSRSPKTLPSAHCSGRQPSNAHVLALGLLCAAYPFDGKAQSIQAPPANIPQCIAVALGTNVGSPAGGANVNATVDAARKAAREDRNKESAALFEQAIQADAAQCEPLLNEFADQLTYSGQAARAVPLYRQVLARPQLSPTDRLRVRNSLGLALAWSNEHAQALTEYEVALQQEAGNKQAQIGRARALAELGRIDDAVAQYQTVLASDPGNEEARRQTVTLRQTQSANRECNAALAQSGAAKEAAPLFGTLPGALAEEARTAARADHNRDAADLFAQAIAAQPHQCVALLKELADQLTYSDRAAQAVPLYRYLLAQPGKDAKEQRAWRAGLALALSWSQNEQAALAEYDTLLQHDPADRDARLGKARVLSWQDKLEEALAQFRVVLSQDADNGEAHRGVARMLAWQGRHQQADGYLRDYIATHPNDHQARVQLAQNQFWLGRTDKATGTVTDILAQDPSDMEARKLQAELERARGPATRIDAQGSRQSDELDIHVTSLEQNFSFGNGRVVAGPRYQRYRYAPQAGSVIHDDRLGLYGQAVLTDQVAVTGEAYADRLRGAGVRDTIATGTTYLTYRPNDALRMDIGFNRALFDNITSLSQGLYANYATYSMDIKPDRLSRLTLRANRGWYSDTNRRNWAQIEAEHKLSNNPSFLVGARYTWFDFTRQLNNGYFNPDRYRSLAATVHWYGNRNGKFYYDFEGSYGREDAEPGGSKPIWSAGMRLSYLLSDQLELEGRLQRFQSSNATTSGFARSTAGVALRYRW